MTKTVEGRHTKAQLPAPQHTNWDQFPNWQLVLPPNRPSENELTLIERRLIRPPAETHAAVLGSTIEFRDLLSRLRTGRVTVLEKYPAFTLQLEPFRLHPGAEEYCWGDWLNTLPSMRGAFDLILSDLTSGNVSYESLQEFYSLVLDALRPGGLFIDRRLVVEHPFLELPLLDFRYLQRPCNLRTLNDFSSEYLFLSELVGDHGCVDSSLFYQILAERDVLPYIKRLASLCELITPPGHTWHYGRNDHVDVLESSSTLEVLDKAPDLESVYAGRATQTVYRKR